MILVITNKQDPHADFVIQRLKEKKAHFYRFNTEDFPTRITSTVKINGTSFRADIVLPVGKVELSNIRSVWYRRPEKPIIDVGITQPGVREHAVDESESFLNDMWIYLEKCLWVNHPLDNRKAREKLAQLKRAARLGFSIPRTISTNDPSDARKFIESCNQAIIKTLKSPEVFVDDELVIVHTSVITRNHLQMVDAVRYTPCLLQEYIEKDVELRITVIGNDVFAAEIHSQELEDAKIDWRKGVGKNLKHTVHKLPLQLEDMCREYVQGYGLSFGTMDFILTPEGEYVFLELNPNGQWVWIELETGMPMIEAMANLLINA